MRALTKSEPPKGPRETFRFGTTRIPRETVSAA
jgi:hypothetical protein